MKTMHVMFVICLGITPLACTGPSEQDLRSELDRAIFKGEKARVRELLGAITKRKISLNTGTSSPLHVAADRGQADTTKLLLEYGCDVNQKDDWGKTPLHVASEKEVLVVKCLLDGGADVELSDRHKWTALDIAVWNRQLEIAKVLLLKGAIIKQRIHGGSPIHLAAERCEPQMMRELLKYTHDIDEKNGDGLSALEVAALTGNKEVALLLEKNGGKMTLPSAVSLSDYQFVVTHLKKHPASISWKRSTGESVLHLACHFGDEKMLTILLGCGADALVRDCSGEIPIHEAARRGFLFGVKKLSSTKDVDSPNSDGQTPLHLAAVNNRISVVEFLLEKNCDPNSKDNNGTSVLHSACEKNHWQVSELLLRKKADPNCRETKARWTPLHFAVDNKNLSMTQALIRAGAKIDARNSDGKMPIDFARDRQILELLRAQDH